MAARPSWSTITTSGDKIQDRTLTEAGGKGLFTKEIEVALLAGRIHAAVHSLKDMPAGGPTGPCRRSNPERREDPRWTSSSVREISPAPDACPTGAWLGTAVALRRAAQALHRRPDLTSSSAARQRRDAPWQARTRRGQTSPSSSAAAGLARLGLPLIGCGSYIDPVQAPPAPGQGALAIQTRAEDAAAPWLAAASRHAPTATAPSPPSAARSPYSKAPAAPPSAPIAWMTDDRLDLVVEALTDDGSQRFRRQGFASAADEAVARALGERLGREVAAEYAAHGP